ncbi:hypothetical protein A3H22_03650 [Candidatus Peribacteria bacterium RIFCSPLOWO2_12_FULL_55_15]|nr:MAG: hypothetical protein A2789_01210 [Candidatus Peribacteria bacterium RIFCSPHIGHO2_01_FULL_54_22]OGJ63732.1 MAG: hypothetical protein A3D12_03220 [Candidatus Peribacteria bacterium RIFCSPHIGHO2_02_FULL_55_24]OGJ68088.1 MAG: hypothetical protein A2947_02715 [Candidatus Peribacteria bacterium RIFCSPLOWO2_01_FULL_54_110]OGJ68948.1 MAG: hypothetical protein A3H90_04045 [Candidatus Peribacteria bacterium RIFCSPLOWO2_02_FULL_55_36]OGJ70679.1 MAG: hypothetical protein A3H22_03650 [Candidatus Per
MTTRLIGIKQFRRDLTKLSKEARTKNVHFIVMRHSVPQFRVSPMTRKELEYEQLKADIAEARAQVRRGEGYSSDEVRAMLGI